MKSMNGIDYTFLEPTIKGLQEYVKRLSNKGEDSFNPTPEEITQGLLIEVAQRMSCLESALGRLKETIESTK